MQEDVDRDPAIDQGNRACLILQEHKQLLEGVQAGDGDDSFQLPPAARPEMNAVSLMPLGMRPAPQSLPWPAGSYAGAYLCMRLPIEAARRGMRTAMNEDGDEAI